eukprot:403330984
MLLMRWKLNHSMVSCGSKLQKPIYSETQIGSRKFPFLKQLHRKMDPYVVLEFQGNKFKTRILKHAGKHPIWNEEFTIHVNSMNDEIRLIVKDKDFARPDDIDLQTQKCHRFALTMELKIGQIEILSLFKYQFLNQFTLDYKRKQAGQILLESRFYPSNAMQQAPLPMIIEQPHEYNRHQLSHIYPQHQSHYEQSFHKDTMIYPSNSLFLGGICPPFLWPSSTPIEHHYYYSQAYYLPQTIPAVYAIQYPNAPHEMETQPQYGELRIKVVEANLFRNTDWFTKMDPYVVLEFQGNKFKTRILKHAGKHPIWNEEFTIHVNSMNDEIRLIVKDKDFARPDDIDLQTQKCHRFALTMELKIGQIEILSLFKYQFLNQFTLDYKRKQAGQILLESRFYPSNAMQQAPLPMIIEQPHEYNRHQLSHIYPQHQSHYEQSFHKDTMIYPSNSLFLGGICPPFLWPSSTPIEHHY